MVLLGAGFGLQMKSADVSRSLVVAVGFGAVEPHFVGGAVEVLPVGMRHVQVVTEVDQGVEGKSEFVVLEVFARWRQVDVREVRQLSLSSVEVAGRPVPTGPQCRAIISHGCQCR